MMFMIGQGERTLVLAPAEAHPCPHCDEVTAFEPQLRYRYGEFDLLFGFVYARRYQLACTQCNHGWVLDRREAEQAYGRPHIPLRLRVGLPLLLLVLAGLGAAAWLLRQPS